VGERSEGEGKEEDEEERRSALTASEGRTILESASDINVVLRSR